MTKLFRFLSLGFVVIAVSLTQLTAQTFQLSRQDRERMQRETVHAIDLIQSLHYRQMSFAELDPEDILRAYMEELDQTRMFFLAEDVDFNLRRFSGTLKPTYLFTGDLFPAFEIFGDYAERVRNRVAWVQERLQQPFDFDTDATFRVDRREEPWPADQAASDTLWEQRLKFELLGELLEDETLERAVEKISRRYERMLRFLNEFEAHTVQEMFLTALAGLYDPHSSFFSWETAREFDIQISNSLIGIGAQLREVDGYSVLERLMPGGPAEMSGQLHPGDKIIAVAQGNGEFVDVVDMRLRRVVQMIRGPEGSEVRLTVIPADSSERRIVTLIRQRVELTANLASAQIFDVPVNEELSRTIGVIALPSFYGEGDHGENPTSTSRDVRELVEKLMERGVDGIVLDLRNNGGGRLDEAVRMTGLFIPSGPVVLRRSFNGRIDEEWDRSNEVVYSGPLAVLVSRRSASASEIVAGALQAAGRALVIGDAATHGKGTVQQPIDLRNSMRNTFFNRGQNDSRLGMVKLTVHQFYLPNGASTHCEGLNPTSLFQASTTFCATVNAI
ncbi:MAG: S41 family peptidase [Verrucomicrobia bacterium]|nr:S41 family peptidase [Verrucomicrobiota bacterium]